MTDPYETLGLARSATEQEIKQAFKTLARKFHPDLHPGDKSAEAKFKDVSAAHDLLKDKEKRRRFDAGEIDASGAEKPQQRPTTATTTPGCSRLWLTRNAGWVCQQRRPGRFPRTRLRRRRPARAEEDSGRAGKM